MPSALLWMHTQVALRLVSLPWTCLCVHLHLLQHTCILETQTYCMDSCTCRFKKAVIIHTVQGCRLGRGAAVRWGDVRLQAKKQ